MGMDKTLYIGMKIHSISPCAKDCGGINLRQRRFLSISTLALGSSLAMTVSASAQGAVVVPPTTSEPLVTAPLPSSPRFNVLIVALDDLTVVTPDPVFIPEPAAAIQANVPVTTPTLPNRVVPLPQPVTPVNPNAVPPIAPVAPAPLEPLAPAPPKLPPIVPANPASYETTDWGTRWIVNAQQVDNTTRPKTKKEIQREREAELFMPTPDRGVALPAPGTPPLRPIPDPMVQLSPILPQNPPGRAQLTAISLRRLLMARGFTDVLTTAPDGNAIERTIGDRRLTSRVLDSLKRSMNTLSRPVAPEPTAVAGATRSAVRIGQALGYRAVIVLYMTPPSNLENGLGAGFTLLLADASKETGEPILVDETGADETILRENGATSAAALLDKSLRDWPMASNADRLTLSSRHLENAKIALEAGNINGAHDEINQAISLDPTRAEAFIIQADVLKRSDPQGAANALRRASELNIKDGQLWARIAQSYAYAANPDWPQTLSAAAKALAANYDSASLRIAMATAQYGRASLFRNYDRAERAVEAEAEARTHLDRALELAPNDPSAIRLLAKTLVSSGSFEEALRTLDRIAPRYPNDLEIQTQYAKALTGQKGREEDAFVTYGRVWKLSSQAQVDVNATVYRSLALGFDERVATLGKTAVQLTAGVASGAFPRESAYLQLSKLKEDAAAAEGTINVIRPLGGVNAAAAASRIFAADLMNQSLDAHQTFLETGQEIFRGRGVELYRQAIARLNEARSIN
jgi:tetratricopeptide (TPR) repeat protein